MTIHARSERATEQGPSSTKPVAFALFGMAIALASLEIWTTGLVVILGGAALAAVYPENRRGQLGGYLVGSSAIALLFLAPSMLFSRPCGAPPITGSCYTSSYIPVVVASAVLGSVGIYLLRRRSQTLSSSDLPKNAVAPTKSGDDDASASPPSL